MGQTEKVEKAPKTSWFTGLKAEFRKIIWPDQKSLVRQTVAVVAVSVVLGLIIAILDWIIQYGVNFLVGLSF
jgi:preprotein translocase subunit SecE